MKSNQGKSWRWALALLVMALALFLGVLPTIQAVAEKTVARKYALPQGGSIEMQVPPSWRESVTSYEHQTRTITFWPPSGSDYRVTVNIPGPGPRPRGPETEASRQRFMEEMLRRTALPQCEEKDIVSHKFSGAAGFGWYTSLTYKHLKPGERKPGQYRHSTHGTYLVNGDLLIFMVESHEKNPQVIKQAVEMLKSARKAGP